jgi:uncharacterized membrane protein
MSNVSISQVAHSSVANSSSLWPSKFLAGSATFWLIVTIIGQLAFFAFIAGFYGPSSLQGNFAEWAKNTNLLKGYVPSDARGNLFFAAHVLLAAVIALGGILQLLPQIRKHAPRLHRWNGRVFMLAIIAASLSGLYLVWVRGTLVNFIGGLAISLDGVLIVAFAIMAWRAARTRDFESHRRWALRTFIVASGVWFMRLGYIAWFIINQGPVGVTKKMDGPFDLFWAFGCYLVPLAVLELYFFAQRSRHTSMKVATAITITVGTVFMSIGVVGASMFMWLPLLKKAFA